ncbi:MAG: collagenase [Flavobacteriaceae bacterium]|nr:collagenase [Flavobacteriaceae bacterium]MCB0705287.1 collagenase [Saprospiraceae bacterium]
MKKTIKRVFLSSISILGVSFLFWLLFFLNPNWSYANKTQFEFVTVYHNGALDAGAELVIMNAISIIKDSELFTNDITIHLCLNDDPVYPKLHPLAGNPIAYAFMNKTIIKNCELKFDENVAETQWEVNDYELRKFNLTWLLAHEFTHNLQYHENSSYFLTSTIGTLNWKLEGHAEYISRQYKDDGRLKEKVAIFQAEEQGQHIGLPVFETADGTRQILSYFKYALIIQYLMEEKEMSFKEICESKKNLEQCYADLIQWSNR